MPFPKKQLAQPSGLLEFRGAETLSCSQFVRHVVDEAFGPGYWLRLIGADYVSVALHGGAKAMWMALEQTTTPKPGDLRFFGTDESDDWHTMMVIDGTVLIGAVPGDAVRDVPASQFSEMLDRGARMMPLPSPPPHSEQNWSPDFDD